MGGGEEPLTRFSLGSNRPLPQGERRRIGEEGKREERERVLRSTIRSKRSEPGVARGAPSRLADSPPSPRAPPHDAGRGREEPSDTVVVRGRG